MSLISACRTHLRCGALGNPFACWHLRETQALMTDDQYFLRALRDGERFLAGAGSLITLDSSSASRLPASQGQLASSAISAKLSWGSGKGNRPRACSAVAK